VLHPSLDLLVRCLLRPEDSLVKAKLLDSLVKAKPQDSLVKDKPVASLARCPKACPKDSLANTPVRWFKDNPKVPALPSQALRLCG
jgi:hypothetical protein